MTIEFTSLTSIKHPIAAHARFSVALGIVKMREEKAAAGQPVDPLIKLLDDFIRTQDPQGEDSITIEEFSTLLPQILQNADALKAIELPDFVTGRPKISELLNPENLQKLQDADAAIKRGIILERANNLRTSLAGYFRDLQAPVPADVELLIRAAFNQPAVAQVVSNNLTSDQEKAVFHAVRSLATSAERGDALNMSTTQGTANYLKQYFSSTEAGRIAPLLTTMVLGTPHQLRTQRNSEDFVASLRDREQRNTGVTPHI